MALPAPPRSCSRPRQCEHCALSGHRLDPACGLEPQATCCLWPLSLRQYRAQGAGPWAHSLLWQGGREGRPPNRREASPGSPPQGAATWGAFSAVTSRATVPPPQNRSRSRRGPASAPPPATGSRVRGGAAHAHAFPEEREGEKREGTAAHRPPAPSPSPGDT